MPRITFDPTNPNDVNWVTDFLMSPKTVFPEGQEIPIPEEPEQTRQVDPDPPPAVEVTKLNPDPAPPQDTPPPEVTRDDLKNLMRSHLESLQPDMDAIVKSRNEILETLQKVAGVTTSAEIPDSRVPDVYAAVKNLIGGA